MGENFFPPVLNYPEASGGLNQDSSSPLMAVELKMGLLASLSISFYFCKVGPMTTITYIRLRWWEVTDKSLAQPGPC